MPFKRTRTGCLTCREDGYKCDEQKPFCGRCVRLSKSCKGYGLKLKWQSPVKPQAKATKTARKQSASTNLAINAQHSAILVPSRTMGSGMKSQHAYLLNHWSTTLAALITMAPTVQNQFHTHITPMIEHSPALRSAVCSIAAYHLGILRGDASLHTLALYYQTDVASSLSQTILTESPLVALATIMILQITDRFFMTNSGVNHLQGAKGIIKRAELTSLDCDAGTFLLSLCCYHDAMTSVSKRASPILGLGANVPYLDELQPMQGLEPLWAIISRISSMCSQSRSLHESEGAAIEQVLKSIDTLASREGDLGHTVHAYKEAAYIYLYRVWYNVGSPHPTTLRHARNCLSHLSQVSVSSPLASVHAWPLWTAGCETIDAQLRELVRERVKAMYEVRHMPSLQRLQLDIEYVWQIKDNERSSTGIDKVDCIQAILVTRQREADLI